MTMILAIDPGPTQSAYVLWDPGRTQIASVLWDGKVIDKAILDNPSLLMRLRQICWASVPSMAIEMVQSFGMSVGAEVFETVFWAGRFFEAWEAREGRSGTKVYRKEVKIHFCHNLRAKDPNIRQAILDRFGGKDAAIGLKASQGPLYGIKADMWSALAVALYYADTRGT